MRMPQVRFKVRWLMVAVAIAGLGVGARNAVVRNGRARDHRLAGYTLRAEYIRFMQSWGGPDPAELQVKVAGFTRRIAYHDAMSRKWSDAAFLPWFPVAPDPPEPD